MRSIKNKQVVREDGTSTDHLDLSKAVRVSMPNLKFSTETISLRMPVALLNTIRQEANRQDIPYQSLIKMSLAEKFS
jgi:predicted DNA binding CopG/RHH family protein